MKTKPQKSATIHVLNAFWDTSAIVALCCLQKQSAKAKQAARTYARQVVWWGTSVEAISALNRLVQWLFTRASFYWLGQQFIHCG